MLRWRAFHGLGPYHVAPTGSVRAVDVGFPEELALPAVALVLVFDPMHQLGA